MLAILPSAVGTNRRPNLTLGCIDARPEDLILTFPRRQRTGFRRGERSAAHHALADLPGADFFAGELRAIFGAEQIDVAMHHFGGRAIKNVSFAFGVGEDSHAA